MLLNGQIYVSMSSSGTQPPNSEMYTTNNNKNISFKTLIHVNGYVFECLITISFLFYTAEPKLGSLQTYSLPKAKNKVCELDFQKESMLDSALNHNGNEIRQTTTHGGSMYKWYCSKSSYL